MLGLVEQIFFRARHHHEGWEPGRRRGGERCEFYIFLEWRKSRGKVEEQMFEEPFPSSGVKKEELQLWGWWYEYF